MLLLMVVPIVMVIWYSFMDSVITNPSPQFTGLANYVTILTDSAFYKALLNTAVFTVASVCAHLLLGMVFALMLNSHVLGAVSKAVFRVILILPWLFTAAIIAVLWRLLLDPYGVVNYILNVLGLASSHVQWLSSTSLALASVIFINIWSGYPFFMMSLLAGLQGVPDSLHEAARVDGAGWWCRLGHVTLPQLRPVITSMSMLDVIWTSQQFALVWMTTGGGPIDATEMLSTYTYKLAFSSYQFSVASAAAVVILVLSLILAVFYVRRQRAQD